MDDFSKQILIGVLSNIITDTAKSALKKLTNAKTVEENNSAIIEAKGIIELAALNGTITIEKGVLEAIKSIRCNHSNGQISIDKAKLNAPRLQTGGLKPNSSGTTIITESVLESSGTRVSVGEGAFFKFTGDASMDQN